MFEEKNDEILLNEESDVQSKVGHVAKFNEIDLKISKEEFIGLTKEELINYIENPKWKRIRWIISIVYLLMILILLIGSTLIILRSSRCPRRDKLNWFEKEFIYEIDPLFFFDGNNDGIGDIQGIKQKIDYFKRNSIKSLLIGQSLFNHRFHLDEKRGNLNETDPIVSTTNQLKELVQDLHRKNMHLIIDLPLSSRDEYQNRSNLDQSMFLIDKWLNEKGVDGIRVKIPLELINDTYQISFKTMKEWNHVVDNISKKGQTKLLLIDVPFQYENSLKKNQSNEKVIKQLFRLNNFNGKELNGRLKYLIEPEYSFKGHFWKVGSKDENIPKEIELTINMLIGGTPIVRYGEEISLDQPFMSWTSDKLNGGFSSCSTNKCKQLYLKYQNETSITNVKREEALGGESNKSILKFFRFLSSIRQSESFEYGSIKFEYNEELNVFWFIREAPGHRGFVVLIDLNLNGRELNHLSLIELTKGEVPEWIKVEYQWPILNLVEKNETLINSDNVLIHPKSINIFSWKTKLIKKRILFED